MIKKELDYESLLGYLIENPDTINKFHNDSINPIIMDIEISELLKRLHFCALRDLLFKNLRYINYLNFKEWFESSWNRENRVEFNPSHWDEFDLYMCLKGFYPSKKEEIYNKIFHNKQIEFKDEVCNNPLVYSNQK